MTNSLTTVSILTCVRHRYNHNHTSSEIRTYVPKVVGKEVGCFQILMESSVDGMYMVAGSSEKELAKPMSMMSYEISKLYIMS